MDVVGDLGGQQILGVLGEHARDVECHVAVADDGDGCRIQRPFARHIGMAVEPAHEVRGAVGSDGVDAGDVEIGVADGTGREDHRVVVVLEVVEGDVLAEAHVAEEPDVAAVEHFAQRRDDALDARVVGGDAVADQPVRCRELLEEVDRDVELALGLEDDVGGVDAGGPGAHDGEAEFGHRVGSLRVSVSWTGRRRPRRIA